MNLLILLRQKLHMLEANSGPNELKSTKELTYLRRVSWDCFVYKNSKNSLLDNSPNAVPHVEIQNPFWLEKNFEMLRVVWLQAFRDLLSWSIWRIPNAIPPKRNFGMTIAE